MSSAHGIIGLYLKPQLELLPSNLMTMCSSLLFVTMIKYSDKKHMRRESGLVHRKISGYNPSWWEVTEAGAGSSRSRLRSRAEQGEMNHACSLACLCSAPFLYS